MDRWKLIITVNNGVKEYQMDWIGERREAINMAAQLHSMIIVRHLEMVKCEPIAMLMEG